MLSNETHTINLSLPFLNVIGLPLTKLSLPTLIAAQIAKMFKSEIQLLH